MDITILSAYDLHLYRVDVGRETNDRELRKLAGIIEEELFHKSKGIFHLRHRTRKGGRESYNPLRDGVDHRGSENVGYEWWSLKLIEEVRHLIGS